MAMDMLGEGLIDEQAAVTRVAPAQLDELLHPIINPASEKNAEAFLSGLPAGPGGACGKIVFTSVDAVEAKKKGEKVILVREETNPEDVEGMRAAEGILTARGGMTSHAALVARGWGKCCIVGAGDMKIELAAKRMSVGEVKLKEGDLLTLNGTKGKVYAGALEMMDASENPRFQGFMKLVDKFRTLGVRTNADTPEDAKVARQFGAEGIGLFRTEHMFYGAGSDEPLFLLRKMILSKTLDERKAALAELFPFVKKSMKGTLEAMDGLPVTIRLLDPPLHEFVPQDQAKQKELAASLGIRPSEIKKRGEALHETNPMMGHRGVRLGITYPEVTEMQLRAMFEAASELKKDGKSPKPELDGARHLRRTRARRDEGGFRSRQEGSSGSDGRRSALPLRHDDRDSTGLPAGRQDGQDSPVLLVRHERPDADELRIQPRRHRQLPERLSGRQHPRGRSVPDDRPERRRPVDPDGGREGALDRADLKIGICGEQGGDPASVEFCFRTGLNYVSCSPYRVPIARLAAAQAAIKAKK